MLNKHSNLGLILFCTIGVVAILGTSWFWFGTTLIQENSVFNSEYLTKPGHALEVLLKSRNVKPRARTVKGLYLTAYSAGSPKTVNWIISLINQTELNAVVIDIKDYSGLVMYDSSLPLVNQLGTEDNRLGNVEELIKKLHEHDIYVIA